MRDNQGVARFAPPTPRSRRLGRELRRLREERGMTLEQAGAAIGMSGARISKVELGDIKISAGGVIELLQAYDIDPSSESAAAMIGTARAMRTEVGWWQRLESLPSRYATYIAYEAEARSLEHWEPSLVPGLLQTRAYAQKVIRLGREMDTEAIEQRVQVRLRRQEVLTRKPQPLRLHALLSEAALRVKVGGDREILVEQLGHLLQLGRRSNVTIQVLTFAAGEHLATYGGFSLLSFGGGDPPLGYIETLAGELFLEDPKDIARLSNVYDSLKALALSPAETATYIQAIREEH